MRKTPMAWLLPAMFAAACNSGPGPEPRPENRAPSVASLTPTVAEDHSTTIDLLAGATDPDGDELVVSGFTQPANGTVTDTGDGHVMYRPGMNFNGSDAFGFVVDDGRGGRTNGTVNISVLPMMHLAWSHASEQAPLFSTQIAAELSARPLSAGCAAEVTLPMPDGRHLACKTADGSLYLLDPSSERGPVKLADAITDAGTPLATAVRAPVIVYATATSTTDGFRWMLTRVNLSTLQQAVLVEDILTSTQADFYYALSPDGQRLAYVSDAESAGHWEISTLNLAAPSAQPARVTLPANGNVATRRNARHGFRFMPDSRGLVYAATTGDGDYHLYLVDVDAPTVSLRLTPDTGVPGTIDAFAIDSNGINIAYVKAQRIAGQKELFVLDAANPGVSRRLNPALVPGGNIEGIPFFTAGGGNVVYYADQDTDELRELYVASVLSPGVAVKLAAGPIRDSETGPEGYRFHVPKLSASGDNATIGFIKRDPETLLWSAYLVSVSNPVAERISTASGDTGNVKDIAVSASARHVAYAQASVRMNAFVTFLLDREGDGQAVRLSDPDIGSVDVIHGFIE